MQRRRAEAGADIGRGIRKLRKKRNWKQGVLAEKTGLAISTISLIETGNTNASIYDLEQIAKALETTVAGLMVVSRKSLRKKDQEIIDYVGKAVRSRRLELGLSRQELAYKAGFLPQYISTTENCRRLPGLANLYKLAEALEVSILYFWPGEEDVAGIEIVPPDKLGERFRDLRKRDNLSLTQLSAISGITTTQLSRFEIGKVILKFSSLIEVGTMGGFSPMDIFKKRS